MSRLCLKRVNKEIQLYQKDNFTFPNLILNYNPNNILEWYLLIHDLKDTPYENGIYIAKITLPHEYPLKAPELNFLTETGKFQVNTKICTTFSNYHNNEFSSAWNVLTMSQGLISFMVDNSNSSESHGLGQIKTSDLEKKSIAIKSITNIKTNEIYQKYF